VRLTGSPVASTAGDGNGESRDATVMALATSRSCTVGMFSVPMIKPKLPRMPTTSRVLLVPIWAKMRKPTLINPKPVP